MNLIVILGLLTILLIFAGSIYSAKKEKHGEEINPAILRGYNTSIFLLLLVILIVQKEEDRRKESEEIKTIQVETITTDGDTILLK